MSAVTLPVRPVTTKYDVCTECGVKVEMDLAYPAPMWIDDNVQDSDNEGARCPESDSGLHEVTATPDCTRCGDSVTGCPSCTDTDGDRR
jgi:hypothetical protein